MEGFLEVQECGRSVVSTSELVDVIGGRFQSIRLLRLGVIVMSISGMTVDPKRGPKRRPLNTQHRLSTIRMAIVARVSNTFPVGLSERCGACSQSWKILCPWP